MGLSLERKKLLEEKAVQTMRAIPDCIDLAETVYNINRDENSILSEEEHDFIYELVSKAFQYYTLPREMRTKTWSCPVCNTIRS